MTTTTLNAGRRLGTVPTVRDIAAQIETYTPNGTEMELRSVNTDRLAQHLHGNLWPDASAPTLAHAINVLRAVSDGTEELTPDGDAIVPRDAWNALVSLRKDLERMARA